MKGAVALAAWAALASAACTGHEPIARVRGSVRGGAEAPGDTNVVAVVNFAGGSCSGSLIAPQLVLTARHCVADTAGQELEVVCGDTLFEPPDSPGAIFVVPDPTITNDPDDYLAVSAIRMPPELGDDLCGTDVVLLVLKEPLGLGYVTPLVPRIEQPVEPGEAYSAIGYGVDEDIEGEPSGTRKRLDGLEVSCSGGDCADRDVRDNEWIGSGGPCHGDSGGPALDAAGQVIGVVSRGKSGCNEPVFGDVATRAAWLKAEARAVANTAQQAAPSWACDETNPCAAPAPDDDEPDATCAAAPRPVSDGGRAWPFVLCALLLVGRGSWRGPGPRAPRAAARAGKAYQ